MSIRNLSVVVNFKDLYLCRQLFNCERLEDISSYELQEEDWREIDELLSKKYQSWVGITEEITSVIIITDVNHELGLLV